MSLIFVNAEYAWLGMKNVTLSYKELFMMEFGRCWLCDDADDADADAAADDDDGHNIN